jgi:transposase InsO family protein
MSKTRQSTRITRQRAPGEGPAIARGPCGPYQTAWDADDAVPKTYIRAPVYAHLSQAPEELQLRASTQKLPWVKRFVDEKCPRGRLLMYAVFHAKTKNMPREEIPPYTTLNTWAHQYKHYGLLGLVDAPREDVGQSRALNAVASLITHATNLTPKEVVELAVFGGKEAYAGVMRVVNATLPTEVDGVSYDTVRRAAHRAKQQNPHLAAIAEHGESYFQAHHRLALSYGYLPGNRRLSIDSTVADLWVRVPDTDAECGWSARRPVLTVIQDVGSRLLVTYGLSLWAIDSGICLALLGRALQPSRNYPGLLSAGIPEEISLDKGAEHQDEFLRVLQKFHITPVPRAPNTPEAGGRLERLIGSIQTEVFSNLVGYSKTDEVFDPYAPPAADTKRGLTALKYDPYRLEVPVMALPTLGQVDSHILGWGVTYNARPHVGLPARDGMLERSIAEARAANGGESGRSSERDAHDVGCDGGRSAA